jgi:hypothetical protein
MKTLKIITIALIAFILIHPLNIVKSSGVSAFFTYSPTNPVVNQLVNFTDHSSGNLSSWEWDFGDGTTISSTSTPEHVYVESGYYTVTLTVPDQESIPFSARLFVRKINTSLLLDPPEFSSGGNEATLTATLSDEYGNRATSVLPVLFYVNDSRGDNLPAGVGYTDGIGRATVAYAANSSGWVKAVFNGTSVYAGAVSNVQAISVSFNIIPYAALASAAVIVMSMGLAYLRWRSRKSARVEKEPSELEGEE